MSADRFEQMVARYLRAREIYISTRPGAPAGIRAEQSMDRIIVAVDALGRLPEFCERVNPATVVAR